MKTKLSVAALGAGLLVALAVLAAPPAAPAHTETDVVAVPAGSQATVTLRPTHGCGGSPTVEVLIRPTVTGATATEVSGWTTSSETDEEGWTVLAWTGGSLPADEPGAFPVSFTVPDAVGDLLVFPAIQVCEDGEELGWINGDPTSEYPAPRVLVLPAGSAPATTIEDVPADAPGRELLTMIVDVDNPSGEPPEGTDPTTGGPSTSADPDSTGSTVAPEVPTQVTEPLVSAAEPAPTEDRSLVPLLVGLAAVGVVLAVLAAVLARRQTEDPDDHGDHDDHK